MRTLLTPRGESGYNDPSTAEPNTKVVTITSRQRVDLSFGGIGARAGEQRIYRRLLTETRWQGFWQLPISASTFSDIGQAFSGSDGPPMVSAMTPSQAETDANYEIVATASWGTTVWVTAKATTGFTLNFGTAAPNANQTVSWLLLPPLAGCGKRVEAAAKRHNI